MAPEVVIKDKHTTASDIWSFGCMAFEMVTGALPFASKKAHRLLLELAAGMVTIEWPEETGASVEGKERMDLSKMEDQLELQSRRMREAAEAESARNRE